MKIIMLTLAALGLSIGTATAAVIQSVPGPSVVTNGEVVLIDTSNDTGDWIDTVNDGGTVYIGFDVTINNNNSETGTGGFFGGLNLFANSEERALIGNGWESLEYTVSGKNGNPTDESGIAYVVGSTVRLVGKLTIIDGGDPDVLDLFVNQATEGTPDASITSTTHAFEGFNNIRNRNNGQVTIANLIIADDYASASVIPEPASLALLSLGGLMMIRCRRA